jgi:hypothetical protein
MSEQLNTDQLIEEDTEEINPWTDIWIRPRQTIDFVINNSPSILTSVVLIYLGGVHFGIGQAEMKYYGDRKTISEILTTSIFISGLGGLLTYHLWIGAIDFLASLFGGKGNFRKTQAAFAWAMLPMIAGLILTIVGYIFFEEELFMSDKSNTNGSGFLTISFVVYRVLEVVLAIWHAVLLVVTISQVQRLKIAKSIVCVFGGILLLTLPLVGIILLMK